MSTKNFGLSGIGPDVQYGKAGGRLVWSSDDSDFKFTTDGLTLAHLQILAPSGDNDAATKLYVDNVAAGLDPKEPVRVATTANITTYAGGGGPAGTGQFTSAPTTIDGVTLVEGDRILVKSQTAPTENGIYAVTATTTTWNRATDHDGSPASEISSGNFVFVLEGTVNAGTGWVLQGDGILTLNNDPLNWVQFSASTTILAGNGLVQNGNALDLDFTQLTSASVIALADELIFNDAGVESRISLTNFFNDRDVPYGIGTNGLITRTANDTYASRTITASAVAGDQGISVVNGDGVSGNPTIGIDIIGLTTLATVENGDEMIISDANDASNNRRVTVDALKTYMNAGTSSTSITEGDSTLAIADAGAGTLTTTIDATDVIVTTVGSTTFQNGNDVILNAGSTLTVADLAADRIVYTTTGGLLTSGAGLTFNGTTLAATAAVDITGDLDVDNININDNVISVTNANGNLDLQANGTGDIRLLDGAGNEIVEFRDGSTAVNGLAFLAGATGVAPTIRLGTGAEANIDIGFVTNGTGVLSVVAGTGNYEDNVTADDDIPNKKYVDDAVAGAVTPGAVGTITGTVNLASATAQNIGSATGIPANATVLRAYLDVTVASDAATTVTLGDATNGATSYMAASENDPQVTGLYIADLRLLNGGTARQAQATVATPGTTGTAIVIIEFRYA